MHQLINKILNSDLVLTCGVSGSGKTFIAKLLESKGYTLISSDEIIWSKYGEKFLHLPEEKKREIFSKNFDEIISRLESLLNQNKRIIVDSTMCKRFKRDKVREIASKHGIDPLFLFLNPPFSTLKKRLAYREGITSNDQIVTEEELKAFYINFEAPGSDENFLEFNSEFETDDL